MHHKDNHLSDREQLLAVDGELSAQDAGRVQSHLAACWTCRARKQEIEGAIGEFVHMYRRNLDMQIPPADGPRALLKARLTQLSEAQRTSWLHWVRAVSWRFSWGMVAAACGVGAIGYFASHLWMMRQPVRMVIVTVPNPSLTPGATILLNQGDVCRESNTKNKAVPVTLQRKVFEAYGIPNAEPRAYEVDYLITPALGGADDIHNLWPQSYGATEWNAYVKDALEDHLRDLVCDSQLDLATAQREIAMNWIEAYKKYFHTDRPLATVP